MIKVITGRWLGLMAGLGSRRRTGTTASAGIMARQVCKAE